MKKTLSKLPFFARLLGRQDAEHDKEKEKAEKKDSSKEEPRPFRTMKFPTDADET